MFTAPAYPDPSVGRVLTYTDDVDPTRHIKTLADAQRPPVVPPIYTATDMCDPNHGSHPVEILLCDDELENPAFWARQYAVRVARELGSTALVLLEEQERTIEVFGTNTSIPDIPISCIEDAYGFFAWLASFAARTIVVPSQRETDLHIVVWGVPIRLMTSTDEFPIAKTRAKSKWLAHDCLERDLDPPQLDLVLIENGSSHTLECVDRFAKVARNFLGLEIRIADRIQGAEDTRESCRLGFSLPPKFASRDTLNALGCVDSGAPDPVEVKPDQDETDKWTQPNKSEPVRSLGEVTVQPQG